LISETVSDFGSETVSGSGFVYDIGSRSETLSGSGTAPGYETVSDFGSEIVSVS
jgi:hypothetical protein